MMNQMEYFFVQFDEFVFKFEPSVGIPEQWMRSINIWQASSILAVK